MDTHLRSVGKARTRHRKKRASLVRSYRRKGKKISNTLFRGKLEIPKGKPDLWIVNCRLQDREGTFTVSVRKGVIQNVRPFKKADNSLEGKTFDAKGGLMLPGFTDSHVHLLVGAERLDGCDLEDVKSPEELKQRLEKFAEDNPDRKVLQAYGLNYTEPPILDPKKARFWLDQIVADRPLMVLAHDLHTLWVNSKALEEADMLCPMPPFPRVLNKLENQDSLERDENGIPTGELREPDCYFLVEGALRSKYPQSPTEKLESLKRACAELNSLGITSVHNMGLSMPEEDVELLLLLLELEESRELTLRVNSSFSVVPDENMLEDVYDAADIRDRLAEYRARERTLPELHHFLLEYLRSLDDLRRFESQREDGVPANEQIAAYHVAPHLAREEERFGTEDTPLCRSLVTLRAVKLFLDGVIEKNTAYRTDKPPTSGVPTFTQEELNLTVELADRLGLQVRAHCIGDASVKMMLDAVESARTENRENDKRRSHKVRHRVEHIEISRPEDLPRFKELEVIPSMQPFHARPPSTLWHSLVPKERWSTAFPWRTLSDQGTPPVFGSDWPIVSCDCLEAIRHAASRGPWGEELQDQGLTEKEAVDSFTLHPPRAVHREDVLGRVAPGMFADLVVLSPGATPAEKGAEVALTVSDGRVVYEAVTFASLPSS